MKVFVSWSGELSHRVALFLREWFPNVIQTVDLYVSSEDIDKGARWFADVGAELEHAQFGIVCLTKENMTAPWVLFEVGAISKTVSQSRVTPLLIDLSPSDLKGPLVQFQATTTTESDIKRLTRTINTYCDIQLRDAQFDRIFNKWWPELEQFLGQVASTVGPSDTSEEKRDERELLEEVLLHVRAIAREIPRRKPLALPNMYVYAIRLVINKIKRGLEDLGKPLLAVTLDGARNITINDDELRIEFSPEGKHLRDTLIKPDNMRILRDVTCRVIGKSIGISVRTVEPSAEEDKMNPQHLREMVEQHPTVQKILETFRSEIVDVRRADSEDSELSDDTFEA